jgi:hypothetical protein
MDRFIEQRRLFYARCSHQKVIVDESLNTVECKDCGEKLNPVWVLAQYANRERLAVQNLEMLKELQKKAEEKTKCKCEKCGGITRIVR